MKGSLVPCGHTFSDFQIYDRKNVSKWLEILWNIGKQRRQELNRNKFYKKKVLFEI